MPTEQPGVPDVHELRPGASSPIDTMVTKRGGFEMWETGPTNRDLILYRDGVPRERNHRLEIEERGSDLRIVVVFEAPALGPDGTDARPYETFPDRYVCRARLERRVRQRRVVDATTGDPRPQRTRREPVGP